MNNFLAQFGPASNSPLAPAASGSTTPDSSSSTASSGPSNVGSVTRRRTHDESVEPDSDNDKDTDDEGARRARKRQKQFARATCTKYGLTLDALDWYVEVRTQFVLLQSITGAESFISCLLQSNVSRRWPLSCSFCKRSRRTRQSTTYKARISRYVDDPTLL